MYTYPYPRPSVTVDILVFCKETGIWYLLLIQRAHEPFEGCWALPGGFLDVDEKLIDAAQRELYEETGLSGIQLNMLNIFDKPGRDPRGHTISVAYTGIVPYCVMAKADSDAAKAEWFSINQLPPLAFDHNEIIEQGIRRLQSEHHL